MKDKVATTKRIWKPIIYEVNIGEGSYLIQPQPIERIIEFDTVVSDLSKGLEGFSDTYHVTNGTGKDVQGPFDEEDQAWQYISD